MIYVWMIFGHFLYAVSLKEKLFFTVGRSYSDHRPFNVSIKAIWGREIFMLL